MACSFIPTESGDAFSTKRGSKRKVRFQTQNTTESGLNDLDLGNQITKIATAASESRGSVVSCALRGGSIVLVALERWVVVAVFDPGSWRSSEFSVPSCLALRLRDETEKTSMYPSCLIVYGDAQSRTISVIVPKSRNYAALNTAVPGLGRANSMLVFLWLFCHGGGAK